MMYAVKICSIVRIECVNFFTRYSKVIVCSESIIDLRYVMKKSLMMTLVVLILIRISLEPIGKHFINKSLGDSFDSLSGHIDDLDISLITGSYSIDKLVIDKVSSQDKLPFLNIHNLGLNVSWTALLEGKISLDVLISKASVTIVKSKDKSQEQIPGKEKKENWIKALKAVIPLDIQSINIKDLTFSYQDTSIVGFENTNVFISQGVVNNLLTPNLSKSNLSNITIEGVLNNQAPIHVDGGIDLSRDDNYFDINVKIDKFKINTLNKLLLSYVPLDITSGELTILSEFKGDANNAKAYARVFLDDLDVVKPDQEFKGASHFFIEYLGGFAGWILSAISDNKIATELPFEIDNGKFKVDASEAFWGSLENSVDKLERKFKNL